MTGKRQDRDPLDEIKTRGGERFGRNRGKRVDTIKDEYTATIGTVHMVKRDFSGTAFYGKVNDVESEDVDSVDLAAEWVTRQLIRQRALDWRKVLHITYSRSGVAREGDQSWHRSRNYDDVADNGATVTLQIQVMMLAFLEGNGWRTLSIAEFESPDADKLKLSRGGALPKDVTLPHRGNRDSLFHDTFTLWCEYDEGLYRALSAIQDVIMNARKQLAALLDDDEAARQLAALGAKAASKLLAART